MLTIITGGANTGKTSRIFEMIKEQGKLRRQILLVPDHISHLAEIDFCRFCGDTASRIGEVLTFHRLARRIAAHDGRILPNPLDKGGKILMMQRVLEELQGSLRVYRHPSQKATFLADFITLSEELLRYHVTPDTLFEESEAMGGDIGDKLYDIAMISGTYHSKLYHEATGMKEEMELLLELLEHTSYLDETDLYLDAFSHYTAQELSAIRFFMKKAHSVTVSFFTKPESSLEIFAAGRESLGQIKRISSDLSIDVKEFYLTDSSEKDTALSYAASCFFEHEIPYRGSVHNVHLYKADTISEEVSFVASTIRRMVATTGLRYRDFAIAVRNLSQYEAMVENLFPRFEVPVYLSRRSDLCEKPLLSFVLYSLKAALDGLAYEDVFRFLKTGLTPLTESECDLLENYVLTWRIYGSMWFQEEEWNSSPDGYDTKEMNEEQQNRLIAVQKAREKILPQLTNLANAMKREATVTEQLTALYQYLDAMEVPVRLAERTEGYRLTGELQLADEYRQLWELLCHTFDQFADLLGDAVLDGKDFYRLMRLMISQYSVGTIPATLDQVAFTEISMNDRHRTKVLFILGATDDALPTVSGGGLLSDPERDALLERGLHLAPHGINKLSLELQNIYAALTKPTDNLFITYPQTAKDGSMLRPSFVVTRMESIIPGCNVQNICSDKEYNLTAKIPAFDQYSLTKDSALGQYFQQQGAFEHGLLRLKQGASYSRGSLAEETVDLLYGKELRLSASRIDQMNSCHYAYFLKYGLKARERKAAAFDALQIGNLQHYVLQHVMEEADTIGGLPALDAATLKRYAAKYVRQFLKESVGELPKKSARMRYLFRRLEDLSGKILFNVAEEMAESSFSPLYYELSFQDGIGDMPSVSVTLTNGPSMRINGQVDRVDGWIDGNTLYLRVIDYKTGKKAFDLSDIAYGLNLQMLLYLFALEKEGEHLGRKETIAPAGVLYLPARDVLFNLPRSASDSEIQKALEEELCRSGLLLKDNKVLTAMEKDALTHPRFLPLKLNRNGDLTKGVATAEQLGKLSRYLNKTLQDIVTELKKGNIDADPWYKGEQETACSFCVYQSCCHFGDQQLGDEPRHLVKLSDDEFWSMVSDTLAKEAQHGKD